MNEFHYAGFCLLILAVVIVLCTICYCVGKEAGRDEGKMEVYFDNYKSLNKMHKRLIKVAEDSNRIGTEQTDIMKKTLTNIPEES